MGLWLRFQHAKHFMCLWPKNPAMQPQTHIVQKTSLKSVIFSYLIPSQNNAISEQKLIYILKNTWQCLMVGRSFWPYRRWKYALSFLSLTLYMTKSFKDWWMLYNVCTSYHIKHIGLFTSNFGCNMEITSYPATRNVWNSF